jgi:hypothetical protein
MTRDLRRYARQTNLRLLAGFIVLLFVVGIGLIWIIYGREAALLGAVCLLGGLAPLLLIAAVLWGLDYFVRKADDG